MPGDKTLTHLLDAIHEAGEGEKVSVQDILDQFGERSITPVVLAISLILITPLSGIPGLSTLSAFVIVLVMVQAFLGRKSLWIPTFLANREVRAERLHRAVTWLRKPAAWVDRHSYPRLRILTSGPLRLLTLVLCLFVPMMWPFMELIPFTTTIGAAAVVLMTFGLLTRDGLYVLLGYAVVACMVSVLFWLI